MAGRTASVVFLGNDQALNATLARIETKLKALSDTADAENAKIAASSETAGARLGKAFDEGSTKAGGALSRLGKQGAAWGIPFSASLEKVGKQLDDATTKTEKLHTTLAAMGKVTIAAGLGGFAAAAYEGVKGAAQLQKQMEMLHTQAGATQAQVGQLTKGVLNMAGAVGTGPSTLADGMYHVVSSLNATLPAASRTTAELKVLRIAAEGAKVGNANLVDVTNALDAAVVSGISGVHNYSQAMGALNSIVGAGDMKMQDLADALSTGLLAPMKTYGLSLKDVGGALAVFGDNNIRGQEAATKLTSAVRIMAAPSAAASKALGAVGLGSLQLANDMRTGGLVKALSDLKQHLIDSGASASEQGLIIARAFGGRQSTGVQVLLQQLDRLKAKTADVGKGANQFGSDYQATTHTLAFQMDQLKATVQELADKFGLFLIPKLEAVAQAVSSVVSWLERHKAVAQALAAVIGGVLATAITVFAYTKAVAFVDATKNMVGGIGKLIDKLPVLGSTSETTAGTVTAANDEIEASNATAGASYAALSEAAATASAEVESQVASLATATTTADGTIEVANAAAGASFTAMLGPIGAVALAVAGVAYAVEHTQKTLSGAAGQQARGNYSTSTGFGGTAPSPLTGHPVGIRTRGGFVPQAGGRLSYSQLEQAWIAAGGPRNVAGTAAAIALAESSGIDQVQKGQPPGTTGWGYWQITPTSGAPGPYSRYLNPMTDAREAVALYRARGNFSAWSTYNDQRYRHFLQGGAAPGTAGHPSSALAAYLQSATGKTSSKAIRSLLYTSPLAGDTYSVDRTDQGKDFGSIRGNIGAIGAGIVTLAQNVQGFGQTVVERLTQGPNRGRSVYYGFETGASGVGIRAGQRLAPGQTIGRGLGTGGVEFGFWNPATGRSEGAPFFSGANATPPGAAFARWMEALARGNTYLTTRGGVTTGGGANYGYTVSQLEQAFYNALQKSGESMLTRLGNVIQSGTVRTLTNVLGVSTGGRTSGTLYRLIERLGTGASISQIDTGLSGTLSRASARSPQAQAFTQEIHALVDSGQKSLANLAERLVAAHKAAMATLAQEMYAQQVTKDAESLNLQATQIKDLTTLQQNLDAALLNVAKAEQQQVHDAAAAQVTQLNDQTAIIKDAFAGMAQAIEDATQQMADASAQVVSGIQDQATVKVDLLGERGLYGLNLIAQQLKVAYDQDKAFWDEQINLAKLNVDTVTAQWHTAVTTAQLSLDQVQTQQDMKVSLAQQADDTVHIAQLQRIAIAQQHADSVTLHMDTSVVGPAQIAVDLGATLPKAQQDVLNSVLKKAQGEASKAEGLAGQNLQRVTDSANSLIQKADTGLQTVQDTATQQIALANQTLAAVTGEAQTAIDTANQSLQQVTDQSTQQLATDQAAVDVMTARAQTQFAGTGTIVNIYGVPTNNAAAIADAFDWLGRTAVAQAA